MRVLVGVAFLLVTAASVRAAEPGACELGPAPDAAAIDRMAACLADPEVDREAVRAELVEHALESRDAAALAAMRRALVAAGLVDEKAAALVPGHRDAERAVRRLLGKRKDRFGALRVDSCRLRGAGAKGGLEVHCQQFDGCLGACRDRVLEAELAIDARGWRLVSTRIGSADTGACGCCLDSAF